MPTRKISILVCINERFSDRPSCGVQGSAKLAKQLEYKLQEAGLPIPVEPIGCFGRCHEGPNLRIAPGGAFFTEMNSARLDDVVAAVAAIIHPPAQPATCTDPLLASLSGASDESTHHSDR
ncbi:(2Fe-2S) ferredoxin domain-containing protein [Candidatus Magnetaquicoccus inordinatus]|uniref:(2Fe-2S) ferredoxin domain-containing protein n=1 Tax=Candidatus Magnetaquicoccus inordinatus TaxID=2496818 RepID=UPI00102BF1D0|nr:(2Fe-2S) ferredoxin domain-containing protein [Candidatus Magnetaquicoccus inordinatus]